MMPKSSHREKSKITTNLESLTWLRGFAAWLVVFSHSIRALEVSYSDEGDIWIPGWFLAFDLGSFGVAVFFVLSGFTLYLSNAQRAQKGGAGLTNFYIRRFFRIWPAFAVSLLFYWGFREAFQVYYSPVQGHWIESQFLMPIELQDWLAYLTLTFNITGPTGAFNNAYWSLPVEFQYYLAFPLVVWLMNKLGSWVTIAIGLSAYILYKSQAVPLDSGLVLQLMFTFLGGMFLCHLYTYWGSIKLSKVSRYVSILVAISFMGLSSLMVQGYVPIEFYRVIPSEWVFYSLCALGTVATVVFAGLQLPAQIKSLVIRSGEWSYSLYLYHNLVIGAVVLLLINTNIHSGIARFSILVTLVFPISIALAWASHKWVEDPGIRSGRYLAKKWSDAYLAMQASR